MKNMLFSPGAAGFFLQDMDAPADAVEVSAEVEAFLRQAVIWGADKFEVRKDSAKASYPESMEKYAVENDAPVKWPL